MKTTQRIKITALLIFVLTAGVALKASPTMAISHNPTNLHDFFLDVLDMEVGVTYGVARKVMPDPDPFNTWAIFDVFAAPAPAIRYEGTASFPQRTYLAVNLDAYNGASINFASPAAENVVSGDMQIQLMVTDILPLLAVEVYVGDTLVGNILAGQGGVMNLPTYWFPNGEQEVWVRVVNEGISVDRDDDGIPDSPMTFAQWGSLSLTFSNEVYMENFSPLYSAYGLSYASTTPHDYTFEVFRLNGELLHTETGEIDGTIYPQWNFTDLNSDPVNDAGYIFSLTAEPQEFLAPPPPFPPTNQPPIIPPGGGNNLLAQNAAKVIKTTNFFDKGVTVGEYVHSYGETPYESFNDWEEAWCNAVSYFVNFAAFLDSDIVGDDRYTHSTVQADFTADPYAIIRATQTNDFSALTNALADTVTGSWTFSGHSWHDTMIKGDDNYLSVVLTGSQLAGLLGNSFSTPAATNLVYNRRYFSTIITGCGALNGTWPLAVGTPPGVNQFDNPLIRKSAYVAFSGFAKFGETLSRWTSRVHQEWIDGFNYDTPLWIAMNVANAAYPAVPTWGLGIHGFDSLVYNGEDSR